MGAITKERFYHVTEILFQQMLAVFVLLIFWELFRQNYSIGTQRTWHVILCVIGLAVCMAEGVQIFRKESIVTFGTSRRDKAKAHLVVMAFGFLCNTIGIALKINQMTNENRTHFQSTHAILGLSAWIMSFVVAIGGLITFSSKSIFRISSGAIKIVHTCLGVTVYLIAVTCLGYAMKDYLLGTGKAFVTLLVILIIYVAYSLIGTVISVYNYCFNN